VRYFRVKPRPFAGENLAYLKRTTAREALRRFLTGATVN
jgi:hypothetical protein